MKLKPGEYHYAVAIRDKADLWLTLGVRRSHKGEFFVFQPRTDRDWKPHTSYHRDGSLHSKSYDHTVLPPVKHQPLTGSFQGTEHLGLFAGHGTGIRCDPMRFTAVVEVAPGVLGPYKGAVSVDLVQPGVEPIIPLTQAKMIQCEVFRDFEPWVVIRIWSLRDAVK